jgi:photosystem II stability/assembly factor-like uncharacterized protein
MNRNLEASKWLFLSTIGLAAFAIEWRTSAQSSSDFWIQTRGPEGGYIAGLARLPDGEILASATYSGVFRSLDDGFSWQLANGNMAEDLIGAYGGRIVVDSDGHAFVGRGCCDLLRGQRNGGSWQWTRLSQGSTSPSALTIRATPTGERIFTTDFLPAVWFSDDHGDNWTKVLLPADDPMAYEPGVGLTVAPNGDVWATTRRAVYQSTDAGSSWALKYRAADYFGPPWSWTPENEFVGPIAASPAGDIYVGFDFGDGTLRINPDGSADELPTWDYAYFVTSFAFGAQGEILAGVYQNGGVIYSTDRGDTWQRLGTLDGSPGMGARSIWAVMLLADGTVLAGASNDGVFRLPSGSTSWAQSKSGMIGPDVCAVAVDRQGSIYAATVGSGLFRSDDHGNSWTSLASDRWVSDVITATDIAINSEGTVFAAWWYGFAVSRDRGVSWQDRWVGYDGDAVPPDPYATPSPFRLLLDANNRLIVGSSEGVYFTSDSGQTWQRSGPQMPIHSLSVSPDTRTLLATTTFGWSGTPGPGPNHGLYISTDGGTAWRQDPFFAGYLVADSAIGAEGTLFAAPVDSLDGRSPGLWRSTDGGTTWQKLGGLDPFVWGVGSLGTYLFGKQVLFNDANHLFVATPWSMVRSKDNGDTWESLPSGLAEVPVRAVLDLTFDRDGFCLLGTWGAGVFRSRESTAPFIQVTIDIKPGAFPNTIKLGSKGAVPVAIFSTPTFDATNVNPTSVSLASATVKLTGKGTPISSLQDVNGDGRLDLVVQIDTSALQLSAADTQATLQGQTFDQMRVAGSDLVRVLP